MSGFSFETFAPVFRDNLNKRSRTARGTSDTSVSDKKKKLLKSGDELIAQVAKNTERLIEDVWVRPAPKVPAEIRANLERWYDIVNEELSQASSRYRTWKVPYAQIDPADLEWSMEGFYQNLYTFIFETKRERISEAGLLAYADYSIDGIIHPWADGCGRISTAAVMWLSLLMKRRRLPIFGPRDEHYRSICDLPKHAEYFERCLSKT